MCGILGYYGHPISINEFNVFLKRLKHRGQDGYGIHFFDELKRLTKMYNYIENGDKTTENIVGHTLYTTSSKHSPVLQPISSKNSLGDYTMVFNGNIITQDESSDTKMLINFLDNNSKKVSSWHDLLKKLIKEYSQSFSVIIQTKHGMYAAKDKYGNRPLFCIYNHNSYIFSSETNIINKKDYKINELYKGEIYSIHQLGGLKVIKNQYSNCGSHCLFEYIYFSNKDSSFDNVDIAVYREKIGKVMAQLDNFSNDEYIVCGVPNTGNEYAKSYAKALNLPFCDYIKKNKSVSRTFILKNDEERNKYARLKYIIDPNISGKRIIVVDDSLVRGITLLNLINLLYNSGVIEVHIRIMSPPIVNTCEFGIDIPTTQELIYPNTDNIRNYLKCDSIKYLNKNQSLSVFSNPNDKCTKCMDQNIKYDW